MKHSESGLQRVRIFVSSPGDVRAERKITEEVLGFLQAEFSSYLYIDPLFWENEVQFAHNDFQTNIEPPSQSDLFICILWSRLGTRLHPQKYTRPDGSPYLSGTEFEFEDAITAFKKTRFPHLMLFKSEAEVHIPDTPPNEFEERTTQRNALRSFFEKWSQDEEHSEVQSLGFTTYKDTTDFKTQLTKQLQSFFQNLLPEELDLQKNVSWKGSPFRGLEHFDYEHAPIFKGRSAVTSEVLLRLKQQFRAQKPFMLIGGSSGVGKSSLVRAGLLRLLLNPSQEWNALAWHYAQMRPSDIHAGEKEGATDFTDALARALTQSRELPAGHDEHAGPALPSALPSLLKRYDSVQHLAKCLREKPAHVAQDIKDCLTHKAAQRLAQSPEAPQSNGLAPEVRLCLLLDQLEEVFTTSCASMESIHTFFAALRTLVEENALVVIATIRADYLSYCEDIPHLQFLKDGNSYYHLSPPTTLDIGSIIREPAKAAAVAFEHRQGTSLDEVIRLDALSFDALEQKTTVLPLLEFTLTELYEQAQKSQKEGPYKLTFAHYEAMGGLQGAIATKADATFTAFRQANPAEASRIFSQVMRCLATSTQDGMFSRQKALRTKIESIDGASAFVDAFIEARLFTADSDENNNVTLSLVHETLLHHWQYLRLWLEQEREYFTMLQRVQSAYALWKKEQEPKDLLLPEGKPLRDAEHLRHEHTDSLSAEEIRFIALSKKHAGRQKRRLYMLVATLIAGFTLAIIMFYQARIQEQKAIAARDDAEHLVSFLLFDLYYKLAPVGRLNLMEDLHKEVQGYYTKQEETQDPYIQNKRNTLLLQQGSVLAALGKKDDARAVFEKQLTNMRKLAAQYPHIDLLQIELTLSLNTVGNALRRQGENQEALKLYEESLALLQKLEEENPQNETIQKGLDTTLQEIGDIYNTQGAHAKALIYHQKGLEFARSLLAKAPNAPSSHITLSSALINVGDTLSKLAKSREALPYYEENLQNLRQRSALKPGNFALQHRLAVAIQRLGDYFSQIKQDSKALPYHEEYVKILRLLTVHDPKNAQWQRAFALGLQRMGDIWKNKNDFVKSREFYNEALDIITKLRELAPHDIQWTFTMELTLKKIALLLQAQGNTQEALDFYKQCLELNHALVQQEPNNPAWQKALATTLGYMADILYAQGKYQEALEYYAENVNTVREMIHLMPQKENWKQQFATILASVGQKNREQNNLSAALQLYREYVNISRELLSQDPKNIDLLLPLLHGNITTYTLMKKTFSQGAEGYIKEAIDIYKTLLQLDPQNATFYKEDLQKMEQLYRSHYPQP